MRLGFRLVRGLSSDSAARIVEARNHPNRHEGAESALPPSPTFDGIDDFINRTRLKRQDLELLAESGALEGIVAARREALWSIRAPRASGLFGDRSIEPAHAAGLPPLESAEQLALDYGTVGLSLHDHPMRHVRKSLRRRRIRRACEQAEFRRGQQVTVAGVVQSRQRPMTAGGVVFLTLEDETGLVNLVVYPSVYEAHELVVRHAAIIVAQGRVDRRGDVVHVKATRLERIESPSSQPMRLRSRDFH
jgi:error-prone DNA polymerase